MKLSKLMDLAGKHSDKIAVGIDKAAATAKQKQPTRSGYIDKAAAYAKKTVEKQKR